MKIVDVGGEFQYGQSIKSIAVENGQVAGVDTEVAGRITGDAYVCAMGSYATGVLSPTRVKLPVYPVKDYSVTRPVIEYAMAPQSTIMDGDPQGCDHPAGRPHPHGRTGRDRRLFQPPRSARNRHSEACDR